MATIYIPVEVMDEGCSGCQCMELEKESLYGMDQVATLYSCTKIHMCQYIRNRIVRNEAKAEKAVDNNE